MSNFIHLQTKSHYSISCGLPKTNEIVDKAIECGMDAVALADKNTFFGLVKFYNYAVKKGIKPICGVDFDVKDQNGYSNLILLAKNKKGLEKLFKLSTESFIKSGTEKRSVPIDDIFSNAADIVCILPASSTGIKNLAARKDKEYIEAELLKYKAAFDTNFFVGVDDVVLSEFVSDQMSGKKDTSENYYFTDPLFGDFQHQSYKVWVGQEFSKWFSDTFNYPLIPYVKGKALGNDIPLKFADSDEILNLRLPSLDFGFVINVKGFKKVKLDESKLREAYAWAAFSSIEFHNVGIKKLTEIDLKNVLTAEVNKGDGVDDWDNFNTSFNRIMKDYVSNMGVYDKKWLSKSSKMPAKDFKKHVNLIKKNIRLEND